MELEVYKNRTAFLDGIRGIAALYVMIGHARWLLWEGFSNGYSLHPESYNLVEKSFAYFLSVFKFGYNFVLLFFVLSGFVIHYSVKKNIKSPNYKWGTYFFKRAKRIYPPFLFAIFLTFCIDSLGAKVLSFDFYKIGSQYSSFTLNHENTSFKTLVGNIFFLMKSYVPIYGSNESTWSLSYEWWFYSIYPLTYIVFKNNLKNATIILLTISIVSLFLKEPIIRLVKDIFYLFPIWWIGVLLSQIYLDNNIQLMKKCRYFAILFLLLFPLAGINNSDFQYITNILWGLAFMGLISLLLTAEPQSIIIKILVKLRWLGNLSYTLYVIHLPFLFLFHAILLKYYNHHLPKSFIYFLTAIPLMVGISYILSKFIEKPFK